MKLFGSKHTSQQSSKRERTSRETEAAEGGEEQKASARRRRTAKKHKLTGLQRGLILLAASILVLVAVVVCIYKALVKPPEIAVKPDVTTQKDQTEAPDEDDPDPIRYTDDEGNEVEVQFEMPGSHVEGRYNILLLGTDGDGTRTDTILIAHMDAIDHEVALMSIPRDTLIYGNYTVPKINSVYGAAGEGEKGVKALEKQLASILGFEVDGYALVDLEAFVEIIDIIGGVTFDVPQRMYYNDPTQNLHIDLYAGEQLLDGQHAMQLVRYRSWAAGDIRRTETQRDFLKALADKLISLKTITKIRPIIETCMEYVDTDLTLGNILYFAQELLKCDLSEMVSVSLPGANTAIGGGSYWYLYPSEVLEIVNESFNPYDADIPLSSLHIRTGGGGGSTTSSSGGSTTTVSPSVVPEEPEEPVDPDTPNGAGVLGGDPEDPDATEDPNAPEDPDDPGVEPTDPGTTADPGTTTEPNEPEDPSSSVEPSTPDTPSEPVTPEEPVTPTTPTEPEPNGAGILDT